MRDLSHTQVILWQAAAVSAVTIGAMAVGTGPRVWLFAIGVIVGAVAHVKWRDRRGLPALTLSDIRRTTLVSALSFAGVACSASAYLSTAPSFERFVVAVGAALAAAFSVGVLTLCGLSLGTGADQPVTLILPDPAHPGRPRRPARRPRRRR